MYTRAGGNTASPGKRKSTLPSLPRPITNTSTTNPIKDNKESPRRGSLHGRKSFSSQDIEGSTKTTISSTMSPKPNWATAEKKDFAEMILDHLKTSLVFNRRTKKIVSRFPASDLGRGELVCAEGTYVEGDPDSGAHRSEPASSSALNSVPLRAPTSCRPPVRPQMPVLTC